MNSLIRFFIAVSFCVVLVVSNFSADTSAIAKTGLILSLNSNPADTIEWERPRFEEREKEREEMAEIIEAEGINDSATLNAMRHVPRHHFVPESHRSMAYENQPLPIGYDQTISQPFIVAYMTQMIELQAGDKVLEIGTGSGYQAAVLSELTPEVYTIEIVEELGEQARNLFDELGYNTIQNKIGDGYKGWPEHAPFDAIVVTAAPEELPDALIEQLKPGGVMIIPVGRQSSTQYINKITKSEDGEISSERMLPVRFVPMIRGNNN